MSEELIIDKTLTKEEKYKSLIPQIRELVKDESDLTCNLAQICAALKYSMGGFFWVGFYFRRGDELVLGPFQGPVVCSRIKIPNGVCGAAASRKETIIVPDVNKFPGHIACSSESKSEIVIPIFYNDVVISVLDIDSDSYSNFDEVDKTYLEELGVLVSELMSQV
ncbi:MAG TPA: GAF domain-containing protein [Ignavibacteria bacterium]|jgi:GAF domain-containing protein